jgi:hypothetical protein
MAGRPPAGAQAPRAQTPSQPTPQPLGAVVGRRRRRPRELAGRPERSPTQERQATAEAQWRWVPWPDAVEPRRSRRLGDPRPPGEEQAWAVRARAGPGVSLVEVAARAVPAAAYRGTSARQEPSFPPDRQASAGLPSATSRKYSSPFCPKIPVSDPRSIESAALSVDRVHIAERSVRGAPIPRLLQSPHALLR